MAKEDEFKLKKPVKIWKSKGSSPVPLPQHIFPMEAGMELDVYVDPVDRCFRLQFRDVIPTLARDIAVYLQKGPRSWEYLFNFFGASPSISRKMVVQAINMLIDEFHWVERIGKELALTSDAERRLNA